MSILRTLLPSASPSVSLLGPAWKSAEEPQPVVTKAAGVKLLSAAWDTCPTPAAPTPPSPSPQKQAGSSSVSMLSSSWDTQPADPQPPAVQTPVAKTAALLQATVLKVAATARINPLTGQPFGYNPYSAAPAGQPGGYGQRPVSDYRGARPRYRSALDDPNNAFSNQAYARTAAAQQLGYDHQAIREGRASQATRDKYPDLVAKIERDTADWADQAPVGPAPAATRTTTRYNDGRPTTSTGWQRPAAQPAPQPSYRPAPQAAPPAYRPAPQQTMAQRFPVSQMPAPRRMGGAHRR